MRLSCLAPLLLAATASAQQSAPPKPAIVEGTVVDSITRAGLRKVEITLATNLLTEEQESMMKQVMGETGNKEKSGTPKTVRKSFAATTDASGKFHFEVEAGDYYLKAVHAGYGDGHYKPEGKFALDGRIHLQAGDQLTALVMRLVPHGAVSGRVVDEDGDPVVMAMVVAQSYSYATGRRRLTPADTVQTNDRGEFRLGKLPPGRYYIGASMINISDMVAPPPPPVDGGPEIGYVCTYYPKVTDVAQAAAIDVAAGADLPGFVIQMQKSKVVRIKGKAVADDGTPLKTAQIMLMSGSNVGSMRMKMMNDPQGQFEIAGVQPGSYVVMTMQMGGSSPSMHMQPLVVPGDGLKDVVLGGQKDGEVHGTMAVAGNRKVALQGIRIMLQGDDAMPTMPEFGTVAETGEFVVNKVGAQSYGVTLDGLPDGAYLKSVQWGGRERLGQPVDFSAGFAGRLEITLGTDGGQYEATVSRDDKPVSNATVVLVAADPAARFQQNTYTSETDAAGHVTLKDISPGGYLAFAWEEVEFGAWFDPAFLKPLEAKAVSVTIQPSAHEKAQLSLIASGK